MSTRPALAPQPPASSGDVPGAGRASAPAKPPNAQQQAMHRLGLRTDWDLVLHLPLRHEDETRIDPLAQGRDGQMLQFEGTVTHSEVLLRPRRQLRVTVLDAADGRSVCLLRFIHFYPGHQKTLAVGERVRVRGEVRVGLWGREMVHPTFKPASAPLPQGLTPVYPSGAGLSQAYLRKAVTSALGRLLDTRRWHDTLTPEILNQIRLHRLFDLRSSLLFLHNPTPDSAAVLTGDRDHPAWQRLKLEELVAQQLSQLVARRERAASRAPVLAGVAPRPDGAAADAGGGHAEAASLVNALLAALPFGLTGAQVRVSDEIAQDLARPVPMHRLLQGDVGAGKTVVAALAACRCMDAGWQCALMAPTEILAQQHFAKLVGWLAPLLADRGQTVAWLTGSQKKKTREAMLADVASGRAGLVVGTHALIQDSVRFARLGLAVIDEQHRFGVAQRLALLGKLADKLGGAVAPGAAQDQTAFDTVQEPHLLMMTATPIPRTLAMSYYADLDVSTLDELPPGRTPIVTRVVSDERREEVVHRIAAQVAQGRQVYWVCPLIEPSQADPDAPNNATAADDGRKVAMQDLRNVTDTHAELAEALAAAVPGAQVGLLHSRLPPAEKQAVMDAFSRGELAVLVSTTVIEVGVDVPNASLMVIEHAERFGLSQLHQLRGRVGRGTAASACVLLYSSPLSPTGRERLRAMAQTNDGFEIARIDLALRGPGEFLGARQSGDALLRFANLETDAELLEWARQLAPHMLAHYPRQARAHMDRWLGARSDYLKA